jgi:hypothetical protein
VASVEYEVWGGGGPNQNGEKRMIKAIERYTTSKGNELEFCKSDVLGQNRIIVRDKSCLLERVYTKGGKGELEIGCDKVEIKSFAQVIRAWKSEQVWF